MKKLTFLLITVFALAIYVIPNYMPVPVNAATCTYSFWIDPTSFDFADTNIGETSATKWINISNGAGACSILSPSFALVGTNPSQFNIVGHNCPAPLPESQACAVEVSFNPSSAGEFSATLRLSSTTMDFWNIATLTGTGIDPDPDPGPDPDPTAALLAALSSKNDSDGCNASASTGAMGKKATGPAALGLFALMGLVLGIVAIRRCSKKRG